MHPTDPAGEFLRITERYRQMSDEELLLLVPESEELTPVAQQALTAEVRQRGLKVEEKAPRKKASDRSPFKPPPAFFEQESPKLRDSAGYTFPDADSSYDEDRKLVELCTVWSVRDALQVQTILDRLGIPFFMGPENATGVEEVTSDFSKGVSVQIMQIGLPWVAPEMRHYEPADDPTPKEEQDDLQELVIRCPRCHSTEIVFDEVEGMTPLPKQDLSQKFKWTCDSCGNEWEDDGVGEDEQQSPKPS